MESPTSAAAPETPMEIDEAVYPCKACGEILEEGKAFELAGNRWHIDCFRCHSCGTLLDSDANLLLLGDGSLICNNCTYSCSSCGNKIEDLAILTGDQAFCSDCFKCRNCKRKIDNLRYARTSSGIFCMTCHELLMSRRRKKTAKPSRQPSATSQTSANGMAVLDKSLPALPDHPVSAPLSSAISTDRESMGTDAFETPIENPPRPPRSQPSTRQHSFTSTMRDFSPDRRDSQRGPPSSSYSDRPPQLGPTDIGALDLGVNDEFFIPVGLDSSIREPPRPLRTSDRPSPALKLNTRDYFDSNNINNTKTVSPNLSNHRDGFPNLLSSSSRSISAERVPTKSRLNPHISSQEKSRNISTEASDVLRRRKEVPSAVPDSSGSSSAPLGAERHRKGFSPSLEQSGPTQEEEDFKLQEPPKRRTSVARSPGSPVNGSPTLPLATHTAGSAIAETGLQTATRPTTETRRSDGQPIPSRTPFRKSPLSAPQPGPQSVERPKRTESLQSPNSQASPRDVSQLEATALVGDRDRALSHTPLSSGQDSPTVNGKPISKPLDLASAQKLTDGPPARNPRRPVSANRFDKEDFTAPRAPPSPPPASQRHRPNDSVTSIQSEAGATSPLPQYAPPGELSAEDEISRAAQEEGAENPGIFRKVSKAVRHGRSHSDKVGASSPKWPKPSRQGSVDISSPTSATPESTDDASVLRNRLRFAQQRMAELEAEKNSLQEKVNSTVEIRQVNSELNKKRSTMAFLETQSEMIVQELEVMTENLARAKESNTPLDIESMKSEVSRAFAIKLDHLKEFYGRDLERLVQQKTALTAEIANLIQMKDKGFQEYESLSSKNAALQAHNAQLVQSIQGQMKGAKQSAPMAYMDGTANGLGIFAPSKESADTEDGSMFSREGTISQMSGDTEVEHAAVLTAPQVVNIRKGQPKKFNWKKGSHAVAKGLKGAFASEKGSSNLRDEQFAETAPYGAIRASDPPLSGNAPLAPIKSNQDPSKQTNQSWSFLTAQKVGPQSKAGSKDSREPSIASLPPEVVLFGGDLTARCEFEKRVVPSVVSRCIEEVELRGIDAEGVYRKSGSSTQVKAIQQGFERDPMANEVGDPDLDIHAVTGCMKQYFRKLPNPLITFEVYDRFLDAAGGDRGKDTPAKVKKVYDALQYLPKPHRDTLEYLVFHLGRVMEKESLNLMTSLNLAVVFAPTIMRPESIEREMTDMQAQRNSVQCLLENHAQIFAFE